MEEKILVTRSSMPSFEEYMEEIKSIWDTRWLTNMGEKHQRLENELADYLKVENVSLFSNGHMALELILQAMELEGEVITTPFTFASTTHAIVRNGLKPVFCDVNEKDYTIDVDKIEDLITDQTVAIVPVHVYGNICDVERIEEIAKKHNLKVIYDAAHAFGVEYKGRGIATYGDASMFSFHATKVFHSIEGGAICTKDKDLVRSAYFLKNFGIENEEVVSRVGANSKMNEFQAAMGLCNLRHIEGEIAKREVVVKKYKECLKGVEGIKIVDEQENVKSNYAYFPVIIDEKLFGQTRDDICARLKEHNIFARKYFYPLTNAFDCYKDQFDVNSTPVAKYLSERVLTLPLFADLTVEQVEKICSIILAK